MSKKVGDPLVCMSVKAANFSELEDFCANVLKDVYISFLWCL